MEKWKQRGWAGSEVNLCYKWFRHDHKLSASIGRGQTKTRGKQPEKSCYVMVASSQRSQEIVSQLLQFGGVAGCPITDVLNNPAHVAFRPPLGFLKETCAVSDENAEIVRAGRGNG
jgi:hypothetical protein